MTKSPKPTRYSALSLKDLVCLCANLRDDDAWQEFVSRVDRPIALTILRKGRQWGERSLSVVEDLRQITYVKLCKDGCRLLRDFAMQHPEAILPYITKTAANATLDHFKPRPPVPRIEIDGKVEQQPDRRQEGIEDRIFLEETDEHLKRVLTGPDGERDRMIFWLYFRQGMTTKEIASLPTLGLSAKGVGSVIERVKHCIRERSIRLRAGSEHDKE